MTCASRPWPAPRSTMRPPRKSRRARRAISHASYSSLRGRQPAWQTARASRSKSVPPGKRPRSLSVKPAAGGGREGHRLVVSGYQPDQRTSGGSRRLRKLSRQEIRPIQAEAGHSRLMRGSCGPGSHILELGHTEAAVMPLHPLAGKPAPPTRSDRCRPARAGVSRSDARSSDPRQRVKFGTSGHRGTPLDGSLTAAHIAAITQAICDYRRGKAIDGPLYMGKDTHALSSLSQDIALEVLAGNDVDTIVQRDGGFTPTPVISREILVHNRGRTAHLADGIVDHSLAQSAGGWRFQVQPAERRPRRHRRHAVDSERRANELLAANKRRHHARSPRGGAEGLDDPSRGFRAAIRGRPERGRRHGGHPRCAGDDRRRSARRRIAALLAGDRGAPRRFRSRSSTLRSTRRSRS